MADERCKYVDLQTWEFGGEGHDAYCAANSRPMERASGEAPQTPLCDGDNYSSCKWFLKEKAIGSRAVGVEL